MELNGKWQLWKLKKQVMFEKDAAGVMVQTFGPIAREMDLEELGIQRHPWQHLRPVRPRPHCLKQTKSQTETKEKL